MYLENLPRAYSFLVLHDKHACLSKKQYADNHASSNKVCFSLLHMTEYSVVKDSAQYQIGPHITMLSGNAKPQHVFVALKVKVPRMKTRSDVMSDIQSSIKWHVPSCAHDGWVCTITVIWSIPDSQARGASSHIFHGGSFHS
jgi:hypothetical protein